MSGKPTPELLDGETRLVFSHHRSGEVIHQSWPETSYTPIPEKGDRVSLVISEGSPGKDGKWEVEESDSIVVIVNETEYRYNWVHFQDEDEGIDVQRLLTDVFIHVEPLTAIEEGD